jgi:predicted Zn finger-like uncharacterized protein
MKFLCDQCKAKYQIADDKVQGKTLRMKCRKCGHVIEIRSTGEASASGETMQLSALSEEAAKAAVAAPPTIPAPAPAPAAPAPAAPRPGGPPRAGAPTAAPRPASGGAPRPAARPATTAAAADPPGALASAFSKQVSSQGSGSEPPPRGRSQDLPTEEWYAAVDGVPVGPIRLSELRAKYAQGSVTDDSLVWREGYEEWRPLQTLPDLHAVVREDVAGAHNPPRGSLLPSTAAPARAAPRPSPSSLPDGGGPDEDQAEDEKTRIAAAPSTARAPLAAAPAPAVAQPAVAQPLVSQPAAAPLAGADDPFGFGKLPDAPAPATAPATAPAATAPAPAAAPAAAAPAAAAAATQPQQKGLASGTVALIAAACLLLGVVIAVFGSKPTVVEKVVEKRVDVPVSVFVPTTAEPPPTATATAASVVPEASASAPKVAVKTTGGAGAAATAAPTTTNTSKKLSGLDGPEGPAVGPGTGGGGGGGGGALEGKSVESVVASKRVGVRKVCFEPWADKGGASVKITLKIGPDGRVQSSDIATTSGEPAIGQCVQRLSKGWMFPASESGGTFNVPFLFGT